MGKFWVTLVSDHLYKYSNASAYIVTLGNLGS
jgi:hypothetical protein